MDSGDFSNAHLLHTNTKIRDTLEIFYKEVSIKLSHNNFLFYGHNKNRRSFCQQLHWLQIKVEYIRPSVSIANKIIMHNSIYTWTVLTRRQAQLLINQFSHRNISQPVHMSAVNYVLIPSEGNIHHGYPTGLRRFLWATKEIDKATDGLDI